MKKFNKNLKREFSTKQKQVTKKFHENFWKPPIYNNELK